MNKKNKKKRLQGEVVSDKMDKTVVVSVQTLKTHSKYNKKYISTKKYLVHDEDETANLGDVVFIEECRPMSKRKKFKIVKSN